MRQNPRRGITLIELLVVVALVGVVVMLVLPALQSARAAAREVTCTQNLKQIGLGLHNYRVMMTVTLPDGQKRAADGRPRARNVSLRDIKDGSSFTAAFVEKRDGFGWAVGGWAGSEFDVHTEPAYDGDNAIARKVYTGSTHPDGPNALLCDGSVRQLERKQAQAIWYALITRAGGEAVALKDEK